MENFTRTDIEYWIAVIEERARAMGLDFSPQEFIIESEERAREHLAYSGIVPRYTHWSFGKAYDQFETLYKHGVFIHLPYELVINSNPCQAFLLEGNSPAIQLIVIAHVFAHNDFFKNNHFFTGTHPEEALDLFAEHAAYIEKLIRRASEKDVEEALTAAHAIRNQRLTLPGSEGHQEGFNLIRFILEECPRLNRLQKDVLRIVDEEWEYFIPQIETKIMNEGWAAYWHTRILEGLDLPQELMTEVITENAKIVFGIRAGVVNPYHVGITMFTDIKRAWDRMARGDLRAGETWDGHTGDEKIFAIRRVNKDPTFILNYLTLEAAEECYLVRFDENPERQVTAVSNEEGFNEIRETFSRQVGMRIFPVVRAADGNYDGKGNLWLKHEFDGRMLDEEYLRKTLERIYCFWRKPMYLETVKDASITVPYVANTTIKNAPYCHWYDGKNHQEYVLRLPADSPSQKDMEILREYIKRLAGF